MSLPLTALNVDAIHKLYNSRMIENYIKSIVNYKTVTVLEFWGRWTGTFSLSIYVHVIIGIQSEHLGITHLESWTCLYNNIIHMGSADTTKWKLWQGDQIRSIVTSMVLSNELIAGVCMPSKLQKLRIELFVAWHSLIACTVHEDLGAWTWPWTRARCQRVVDQIEDPIGIELPDAGHGVLTSSVDCSRQTVV